MRTNIFGAVACLSLIGIFGGLGGIETGRLSLYIGAAISAVSEIIFVASLYLANAYYHYPPQRKRRGKNGVTMR